MQTVKFHLYTLRRALRVSVLDIAESKTDGKPRQATGLGRYILSRGLGLESIAQPSPRVQAHASTY